MLLPDVTILKTLLQAGDSFVSGSDLAKDLGMSRVGVWSRLEKMRETGFTFEAVRHRGYRLTEEPACLCESLVLAYLDIAGANGTGVFVLPEIDSTNSEAERLLADATETPFVVIAGAQTRGRGRLGRKWHSPPQGNLYMSFAFRPRRSPGRMQSITLRLGLAVCRFLNQAYAIPVKVKWPNDLIIEGKKVAGMLTEARVDADRMRDLVFGIGINVLGSTDGWPAEVAAHAARLGQYAPSSIRLNRLAAELIPVVAGEYAAYLENPRKPGFAEEWLAYDALNGREVTANRGSEPIRGTAHGIDTDGNLILETPDGRRTAVNSGEVSLGTGSVLF
ncbi:MAG: biotin--[acetyl-CoA-carboxylase] ligase [Opitutales bacterium]|nr:biotin--[acetyl-CoA-carboxylase] ligase [Opitutales bacterium]